MLSNGDRSGYLMVRIFLLSISSLLNFIFPAFGNTTDTLCVGIMGDLGRAGSDEEDAANIVKSWNHDSKCFAARLFLH